MRGKSLLLFILFLALPGIADGFPSYDEIRKSYVKSDSILLDRHGEVLHELRTDMGRRRLDWTPIPSISPALKEAVIQVEDKRFYDHPGVDYKSIGAAMVKGLTSESLRGASTITMQLASLLDKELQSKKGRKTIWQKGKQILKAFEIEKNWLKSEILEAYLNLVTFRGELQGVASAARGLFGKDPHGMDRTESLILASLIRSPNASFKEVLNRVSHLNQSMNWGIGEDEIHSKVSSIFLGPNFLRPRIALAPHVARQLFQRRQNGSTITCTLDVRIQRFALDQLIYHLLPLKSQNVKDGAILIVENRTGDVLAYVSHCGEASYGYYVDGIRAKRQAGSSLKPFLYALAFDQRILTPASVLDDTPLDIAVLNGIYQPKNYDSQFQGWVTSRVALASSLNVPAVKTLSLVGIEPFLKKLRDLGMKELNESGDFYGPSLALGSADINLWELTNAYRTLANGGEWNELHLIPKTDQSTQRKRIYSKETVFLVSDILSDREARSITFGLESPLSTRFWTAVKTGTSKDMRDNWCIGYSKKYTVGVWVGNFSGEPMWNVSGVVGAAPIWIEMMNFLHRYGIDLKEKFPPEVVNKKIQFLQGMGSCREEWFIRGTEPHSEDRRIGQFNQRILYPPSGTVIALDPDIPTEQQKIFFISQTKEDGLKWMLNGTVINPFEKAFPWTPTPGHFLLALIDQENRTIDSVRFEVRGSPPPSPLSIPANL